MREIGIAEFLGCAVGVWPRFQKIFQDRRRALVVTGFDMKVGQRQHSFFGSRVDIQVFLVNLFRFVRLVDDLIQLSKQKESLRICRIDTDDFLVFVNCRVDLGIRGSRLIALMSACQ